MEVQTKKTVKVEFFQVDMPSNNDSSCSACETVQSKLESAIQEVQMLFDKLDCEIIFKQTIISSIEEAEKAQIIASPTIRVGNLDFAPLHLSESSESRQWNWNGVTMEEPDKQTLIEVLLKGYQEPITYKQKKEMAPYILNHLNNKVSTNASCGCG